MYSDESWDIAQYQRCGYDTVELVCKSSARTLQIYISSSNAPPSPDRSTSYRRMKISTSLSCVSTKNLSKHYMDAAQRAVRMTTPKCNLSPMGRLLAHWGSTSQRWSSLRTSCRWLSFWSLYNGVNAWCLLPPLRCLFGSFNVVWGQIEELQRCAVTKLLQRKALPKILCQMFK